MPVVQQRDQTFESLSVLMVTYQSEHDVPLALRSVALAARRAHIPMQLIVVDNASTDDSVAVVSREARGAVVIRNSRNVGFATAMNQALALATSDVCLLLNPDAQVAESALEVLLAFIARDGRIAAVAPTITGHSSQSAENAGMLPGIRSAIGHFLFANRLLPGDRGGAWRGFQLARKSALGPRATQWLSGAVLLVRTSALRAVGGFDPSFFLYAEDVDLGRRLVAAGYQLWLVPSASATHLIAASQGRVSARWVTELEKLHAQDAEPWRVIAFDLVLVLGLGLRAVAGFLRMTDSLQSARMRVGAREAARILVSRLAAYV